MKKFSIRILVSIVIGILVSSGFLMNVQADSNYVITTKTVNPSSITTEEEAEITLNISGTPPVDVVKPNDVVLIIDRSGSMANANKMQSAIDSAKGFIDLMDLTVHRVGIVDFSSDVKQLDFTTDKNVAKSYINNLKANGGTNTATAVTYAREMLKSHRPDAQPVIVILTDGDATEPTPNPYEKALTSANEGKDEGIVFYTIALLLSTDNPDTSGPNKLLKDMATTSHHHHFVLGSVGLSTIYAAIVQEIGIASAYDVEVTDIVSPEFEIVPGSYDANIPKPTVVGNTLTWNFIEMKKDTLTFKYKIRHKVGQPIGELQTSTYDSKILYKDYAGTLRRVNIPGQYLTVTNPKPTITKLELDKGSVIGGETVKITGTNFRPNPKVKFGANSALNIQYISPTEIIVQVPPGAQGTVAVSVINDDNQFAQSSYLYYADPIVTSISPNSGKMEGGQLVKIAGNFLMSGIKVKFGDVLSPSVTFNSLDSVYVTVPKASVPGPVDVTFENPDGRTVTVANGYTYIAPPELELLSISPNSGSTVGGEAVAILGKVFSPEIKIYFGSSEAKLKTYGSDEYLVVTTPSSSVEGKVDIKVVNPDGKFRILEKAYTYILPPPPPAPTIVSLSPVEGELKGGDLVNLTGTNFVNGAVVYFDGKVISGVTYLSDTALRFRTPAWALAEKIDVKVVNPDGQVALLSDGFTYLKPAVAPAPTIISLTPSEGEMKGGDLVTLTGSNLVSGVTVYFDAKPLSITYVSDTSVRFRTPAWALAEKVDVKVVNPDGQEALLTDGFTYLTPPPAAAPTISKVEPNSSLTTGGTLVYVYGTNYAVGAKVLLGDTEIATTFLSDTLLRFRSPVWSKAEVLDVKVVNPDNQIAINTGGFSYITPPPPPAPTITSVTPAVGPTEGNNYVYIKGTNFDIASKVKFGAIDAKNITLLDATQLRVLAPASSGLAVGAVSVTVTNPDNQSATSLNSYTYEETPIVITSISPNKGPLTGGQLVYVYGTNFKPGVTVQFNNQTIAFEYLDSTVLRFRTPVGVTAGTVTVKLINPSGTNASTNYVYELPPMLPAPTVSSLSPNHGPLTGSTLVYVYGTNLRAGITATWGGNPITVEYLDSTMLRFRTPVGSVSGTVELKLTNTDGQFVVANYTYDAPPAVPAPVISSLSSTNGPIAGGTLLYLYGSGYQVGATVTIGGKTLTLDVLDVTMGRFRIPVATSSGIVSITVTNPDGKTSNTINYQYN